MNIQTLFGTLVFCSPLKIKTVGKCCQYLKNVAEKPGEGSFVKTFSVERQGTSRKKELSRDWSTQIYTSLTAIIVKCVIINGQIKVNTITLLSFQVTVHIIPLLTCLHLLASLPSGKPGTWIFTRFSSMLTMLELTDVLLGLFVSLSTTSDSSASSFVLVDNERFVELLDRSTLC